MKNSFSLAIATQNLHKIEEIRAILPYPLIIPEIKKDVPEDGSCYLENALTKARAWAQDYPNCFILADDSGVEVDALGGAPGLISADWAGRASPQHLLLDKMLESMEGLPAEQRGASMVCTMLVLAPKGHLYACRGEARGRIALQREGDTAFGYDPLFLSADFGYQKSFSQLSAQEKNRISHRARALKGVYDFFNSGAYALYL